MNGSARGRGSGSPARPATGRRLSEPVVWAVVLIVALGIAYQTWTRSPEELVTDRPTTIWTASPDQIAYVRYESSSGNVTEIERRADGEDSFLWGMVARQGATAEQDVPTPVEAVDTAYFVVGSAADRLWDMLAAPRSPRDLGVVAEADLAQYGLDEPFARISVQIGPDTRELHLGSEVFGEGHRYALDMATGRVYVVEYDLIVLLADAEYHLVERRVHSFDASQIAWATVRSGDRERTMNRSDGSLPGESIWTSPGSPNAPDQTFADFMERAGRLWVEEYRPDLDLSTVEPVLSIEYYAADSTMIGFIDLVSRTDVDGSTEYLFHTEHTRVPARTYQSLADDVIRDLDQIL